MLIRFILTIGLALSTHTLWAAEAVHVRSFIWNSADSRHGGFSGLEVSEDGLGFTAITDHGSIATGRFERSDDGSIQNVETLHFAALKDVEQDDLRRFRDDAEGLAMFPDGSLAVSFEAYHRVWSYASVNSRATTLPSHDDFEGLQNNSSLEALAVDGSGRLYTLPERSGGETVPFKIYRFNGNIWETPFTLPRRGSFLPVGMDIGPDGKLYLLERWFRGIGFSSRVRRFDITETGLQNEETILQSGLGVHDNLEGIAVWHDGENIRLTMIADDNFKVFQVTEFVEYIVTK